MDSRVRDRAIGALIGAAVGDVLGAGSEFEKQEKLVGITPAMIKGTVFSEPGEWTDDTAQTWCIAEAAAQNRDLLAAESLDRITENFYEWALTHGGGMGRQTHEVLIAAKTMADLQSFFGAAAGEDSSLNPVSKRRIPALEDYQPIPTALEMFATTRDHFAANPDNSAGNGSLMRTSPVALAYLKDSDDNLVAAAKAVSDLTHGDPVCADACALWCLGIKQAILTGQKPHLGQLADKLPDAGHVAFWKYQIHDAESGDISAFYPNGWVINAFKVAWAAISQTPNDGDDTKWFRDVLTRVIRVGHDTDTTASIAGALAGALVGAANIPDEWVEFIHGYPEANAATLTELAEKIIGSAPN